MYQRLVVVVISVVFVVVVVGAATAAATPDTQPDLGHGIQVLGKIFRQYINSQPEDLKISDGVHLINTRNENDARSAPNDDKSIIGTIENYLQTHELRIKLPELAPGEGFGRAFKDALAGIENTNDLGSPRGKGGKGGGMGGIVLVGMMMGKMMAALGLGGVGLLAMKALMVSALALMLSLVVGLKKLVGGHDEGGHTVIHASPGHGYEHRRKREAADIAYRAWSIYNNNSS